MSCKSPGEMKKKDALILRGKLHFISYEIERMMLTVFLQGTEFDYGNKGQNIPPPRDRQPDTSNYMPINVGENAHIIQDAPENYQQ